MYLWLEARQNGNSRGPRTTEQWRNCRKIYNVLAVKKTFLYIGPNESHVTDIIRQYDAYVSSHGDVEGVVTNIPRATRSIVLWFAARCWKRRRCFRKID